MHRRIALFLALPILMTACGSSYNPSSSHTVSGNWQMNLLASNNNVASASGFLVQIGNSVTGSVLVSDGPCSGVGTVDGTITGTGISVTVASVGLQINLSGTLGSNLNSMSGNYTILSTGCPDSPRPVAENGTWMANLVTPLSGSIHGTFTHSTKTHTNTYPVTGKINQAPNAGISNTSLSGALSATNYCFTTANIAGLVSGQSVVMNLVNPDGTQIGLVSGTSSVAGTSVTGVYQIFAQGAGALPPCNDGDSGTVMLTVAP